MRILLLSVTFFPEENARANRWQRLATAMAAKGHSVWVLCRSRAGLPAYQEIQGVQIIRVGRPALSRPPMSEKSRWYTRYGLSALVYLRALTWKKVWWPDSSVWWFFPAIREARRIIHTQQIERLYTLSLPFVAHLAGLVLKKRFPAVYWVADHGDPFSIAGVLPQNNHRLFHKLNGRAERQVLRKADMNYTNTPALYGWYQKLAGTQIALEVLPHVLPEIAPCLADSGSGNSEELTLDYFGTLLPGARCTDAVWVFLSGLLRTASACELRVDLRFFGAQPAGFVLPVGRFMKKITHSEVLERMGHSDILLSIGYPQPYMLPMKLMEYLASGRPVLHLAQHPDDPAIAAFKDYPTFSIFRVDTDTSIPEVQAQIRAFFAAYAQRRLEPVHWADIAQQFGCSVVAQRYLQ